MKRDHLKAARLARRLTAVALGERATVKEEKVYQVERGRYLPTRPEAERWAAVLGMTPAAAFPEIFTGTEGGRP
jgi:transcriptional regulator with XRE-family HTH domain